MRFPLFILITLFISCTQQEVLEPEAAVRYTFTGLAVECGTLDDIETRAQEAEKEYSLLLVDVVNDQYVQQIERIRKPASEAFADLTIDLAWGSHKVYFITALQEWDGFDASTLTLTWNGQHPLGETWGTMIPVTVGEGETPASVQVNMTHVVAYTRLRITDPLPIGLATISQTLVGSSWQYQLLTQSGGPATTIARDISIPANYIGKENVTLGLYSFVPEGVTTAPQYKVVASDSEGETIQTYTFTDIPIQANQYTLYQGSFFTQQSVFSLTLNKSWSDSSTTIPF